MASDYGATYLDVGARNPTRPAIGTTNEPTQTTVNGWIDEAEAKMNGALKRGGTTTPITDAEGKEVLAALSVDYADSLFRDAMQEEDSGAELMTEFRETLESMREDPGGWSAELGGGSADSATREIFGHPLDDIDGRAVDNTDFQPKFTFGGGAKQF